MPRPASGHSDALRYRRTAAYEPNGEEIPCQHLHIYREGYGDKWAIPAPADRYTDRGNLAEMFQAFMQDCNITMPPFFQVGLF